MPVPVITIRVLLIIEFRIKILCGKNLATSLTYLFVLKIDLRRNLFKVTVTSCKNVVACH